MNNFLNDLQSFVGVNIPDEISQILTALGYDCALAMDQIDDSEITIIEENASVKWFEYFKNSVHYSSWNGQQAFSFLPGHRKLIKALGQNVASFQKHQQSKKVIEDELKDFCGASQIMKELWKSMRENSNIAPQQRRYSETLQSFAIYIYMLAGKTAYEVLSNHLPLPQASTILKYINTRKEKIIEGELRVEELSRYLEKMNSPKKIWMQEDASGIVATVSYDPTSNQLVGLILPIDPKTGMPVTFHFTPQTSVEIEQQIKQNKKSTLVYVILAQPLKSNVPPFILQIFGSDNRFKSLDVFTRWRHTKDQLSRYGIDVEGVSGDGDARVLACMKQSLNGIFNQLSNDVLSNLSREQQQSFIQDTIHLGTKLRNRLLKYSILLPMGSQQVSVAYLKILLNEVGKEIHGLIWSDICTEDRQNYSSLEKIMQNRVLKALEKYVPESDATVKYLRFCKDITQSFLNVNLSPLERISMIWRSLYFARAWRTWIKMHSSYKLDDNFISDNAFACLEINAYGILHLITKFRDSNEPHLFLTSLFSSQQCENLFRQLRSMTTANWTKINFSLNELLHMVGRIQLQNEICYFKLPNINPKISQIEKQPTFELPSNEEIKAELNRAFDYALSEAARFGMSVNSDDIRLCELRKGNLQCRISANEPEQTDLDDRDFSELPKIDFTCFRQYNGEENVKFDGNSKFIEIIEEDSVKYVRKSSIVWRILEGKKKSSNDRLTRVREGKDKDTGSTSAKRKSTSTDELKPKKSLVRNDLYILDEIGVGDWCIFKFHIVDGPQQDFILGRVLSFKYIQGKTEKEKQYSLDSAPISTNTSNKRGISVLAVWSMLSSKFTLEGLSSPSFFVNIENYVAHMDSPKSLENPEFKVDFLKLFQ